MSYTHIIKNLRTWDITRFVDCDYRHPDLDEDGNIIGGHGDWMPHTVSVDDPRFSDILEQCGEVATIKKPRDVYGRLEQALSKGVLWGNVRLVANNQNERDRILSAATRMNINGTLPKNKDSFGYTTADDGYIYIPKEQVVNVAMSIQDYVEDCHDNYVRLLADESLDINSGWPE